MPRLECGEVLSLVAKFHFDPSEGTISTSALPAADVIDYVAPTFQHYLVGPLGGYAEGSTGSS